MNIFHLQCFSTLADILNFTKAAQALNMTQSALSKVIVSLETELNCKLFFRDKRNVQLTSSGRYFLPCARGILRLYEKTVLGLSLLEDHYEGVLRIGFLGYSTYFFFPEIIKKFQKQYPKIYMQILDGTQDKLLSYISKKEVDFCALIDLKLDTLNGCRSGILYEDEYCIVLPSEHPLADRDEVSLDEFKNDTFITLNQHSDDLGFLIPNGSVIANACSIYGFTPKFTLGCSELFNLPVMIACNKGISILAKHMETYYSNDIRFIKIKDCQYNYYTKGVWHSDNDNPCLMTFLNFLENEIPSFHI